MGLGRGRGGRWGETLGRRERGRKEGEGGQRGGEGKRATNSFLNFSQDYIVSFLGNWIILLAELIPRFFEKRTSLPRYLIYNLGLRGLSSNILSKISPILQNPLLQNLFDFFLTALSITWHHITEFRCLSVVGLALWHMISGGQVCSSSFNSTR